MTSAVFLFIVLSLCMLTISLAQAECGKNRFGIDCMYMCHCRDGTTCDGNGECSDRKCESGWFGPSCQYEDMVSSSNKKNHSHDDCFPSNLTNVSLFWDYPFIFTWMRVKLKEAGVPSASTATFNYKKSQRYCEKPIFTRINNMTYDLHCDSGVFIDNINIGPAVCLVYVSGGRNFAFDQCTTQTGTAYKGESKNAVDGNRNPNYSGGSCTHTDSNQNISSWTINFKKPVLVNRYVLFNRWDSNQNRLLKFKLASYSENGSQLFYHQDSSTGKIEKFNVATNVSYAISSVTITNTPLIITNSVENVLTLCEVEIFGIDTKCSENIKYGLDCDKTCNCFNQSEECLVSTGGCPSGCAVGFTGEGCASRCPPGTYGKDCASECSSQCANGNCSSETGECTDGCIDGYQLSYCNQTCYEGFYGKDCLENCSDFCIQNTCSATNGSCKCKPGFQGDKCSQTCNQKSYGNDCLQNCSVNCLDHLCNHINGTCEKCNDGKTGRQCENDCTPGTYGQMCKNSCSKHCGGNGYCHFVNGTCLEGCKDGYIGGNCSQECEPKTYGSECMHNCSEFCEDKARAKVCHHETGECLGGCKKGYGGALCAEALSAENSSYNVLSIAVPIALVLVLAVAVFLAIFLRRKSKIQESLSEEDNPNKVINESSNKSIHDCQPSIVHKSEIVAAPSEATNEEVYCNTAAELSTPPVALNTLYTYIRIHNKTFFQEQFKKIPAHTSASIQTGSSPEHKAKNRYKNIIPYDHCRVHLSIDLNKKQGDYINASFVKSYREGEKFIASQGPNRVILEDFIRMLWEQKVDKVVMLTNLIEEAKQKCEQYWPKDGEETFGEFRVRLINTEVFADYIIREMEISMAGAATHNLIQYHFTSWPDKGVPVTAWSLVDFEQRVSFEKTKRPVVVHCSAGVGRTGTFIALYNVMCQATETGYIDFFTTLSKLRQDRMLMIQTADQYIFLHEAALVAMLCIDTTVHQNELSERIQKLESKHFTGETYFQKEFKAICDVCDDNYHDENEESNSSASSLYLNSKTVNNKSKNRFSNILPKESYRPYLHSDVKDCGDYINAVTLPSFRKLNQQYVTQLPLPSTVIDFWRLVNQAKVSFIIAFELDLKDKDTTIGAYLPSSIGHRLNFGSVDVELVNSATHHCWEELTLTATLLKKRKTKLSTSSTHNEEMTVTHLQFTGDVTDHHQLLKFIVFARSHNAQRTGKTIYTCRNGADLSGLACVLSLLLDRMEHDHKVTVPLVVGTIKTIRPQIIPTLDQYKLLYKILKQYSENDKDDYIYANSSQAKPNSEVDEGIYANS